MVAREKGHNQRLPTGNHPDTVKRTINTPGGRRTLKRVAVIACLALALAGCAKPMIWDKSGATQQEFNKDSYECERDTRQSGYFGQCGLIIEAQHRCAYQVFYQHCMVAHGYTLRQ
jgi:hypothetical protein